MSFNKLKDTEQVEEWLKEIEDMYATELHSSEMSYHHLHGWRGVAGEIPRQPGYKWLDITESHDKQINNFVKIRYAKAEKIYRIFGLEGLDNMYNGKYMEDGKPKKYPFISVSTNPYSLLQLWIEGVAVLVEMDKKDLDGHMHHQGYTTRRIIDSTEIDTPQSSDNACEEEHRIPLKTVLWKNVRKRAYVVERDETRVDFTELEAKYPKLEMLYMDSCDFAKDLNSIEDGSVPL